MVKNEASKSHSKEDGPKKVVKQDRKDSSASKKKTKKKSEEKSRSRKVKSMKESQNSSAKNLEKKTKIESKTERSKKSSKTIKKSQTEKKDKKRSKAPSSSGELSDSLIGTSDRKMIQSKRKEKSSKKEQLRKESKSSIPKSSILIESKNVQQRIETLVPIKCDSMSKLKAKGYSLDITNGHDNLYEGKGPGNRSMLVKMINLKSVTERYRKNLDQQSIKIMKFIGEKPLCDSFPKIYEIFLIDHVYFIFMESISKQTLYDIVVSQREIPIEKTRKWVRELTMGVCCLQRNGISHRFLKLKHLFVQNDCIKIMGWSKSVLFYDANRNKQLLQHRERLMRKNNFLPPEAFKNHYDPSRADVWSIGIVLIALLTRRYPFHVRHKTKFVSQWRSFIEKHPINPIVRNLCNKIFVIDIKKRIKAGEILRHRFFTIDSKELCAKNLKPSAVKISEIKSKMNSNKVTAASSDATNSNIVSTNVSISASRKESSKSSLKKKKSNRIQSKSIEKGGHKKGNNSSYVSMASEFKKDSSCHGATSKQKIEEKSGLTSKMSKSIIGKSSAVTESKSKKSELKSSTSSQNVVNSQAQSQPLLSLMEKISQLDQEEYEADQLQLLEQAQENEEYGAEEDIEADLVGGEEIDQALEEEIDEAWTAQDELNAPEEIADAADPTESEAQQEISEMMEDAALAMNDLQPNVIDQEYQSYDQQHLQ